MKSFKYIILIFAAFSICSCEEYTTNGLWGNDGTLQVVGAIDKIAVNKESLLLASSGDYEKEFTITSLNTTWEIVDIPSWLDVTPQTGGDLSKRQTTTVTVTPKGLNPTSSTRSAILIIRSTNPNFKSEKTITINQDASRAFAYFIAEDGSESSSFSSSAKASPLGATMIFDYTSNCGSNLRIEAEFPYSSEAMGQTLSASINTAEQRVSVTVPENTYSSSRSIVLRLKSTDSETTYSTCRFTQAAPGIMLRSESTPEISPETQSLVINFDSSLDWSATISYNEDWVKLSPTGGTKGKDRKLTVTVQANVSSYSRTCTIYLQTVTGNNQVYVSIRQQGASLKISKDYYAVHNNVIDNGGDLTITATAPWSIKSSPDWATIAPEKGSAGETNARVKVDYIAWNKGLEYREGDIVLQIDGTNTTQSIKIRQYY